jgi:hypothetical protein
MAAPDPVSRLRAFCFPDGEAPARLVRGVRNTQRGEMRAAPGARWMEFTAEEEIDATCSRFIWIARLRGAPRAALQVTDAYEYGHGRLVLKLGGVVPVKTMQGPDVDKGELQRYLGLVVSCPAMLLNHPDLECTAAGPGILRMRDRADAAGTTVDLELGDDGRPMVFRADRPRTVGKQNVLTPWSGAAAEFQQWEGLRVASRVEASWQLPEGPFVYFRAEVTSYSRISR